MKLRLFLPLTAALLLAALPARADYPGNHALAFDGTNQFVAVPGFGNIIPTNEVTVEFWAYTTQVAGQSAFMLEPDQGANRFQAHLYYDTNGRTYWDFGNISGTGRLFADQPTSTLNSWVHYAFVASASGNFMSIYTNGVLFATKAGMAPFVRGTYQLRLGGNGYFYHGRLDDFRVWNRARTPAEILATKDSLLYGTETNLVVYYRFDAASGTVLTNRAVATGAAYNGSLSNSPTWVARAPLSAVPPVATTLAATQITTTSATLNATVTPGTGAAGYYFQYGLTTSYGSVTAGGSVPADTYVLPVGSGVSGLLPGALYHFSVVATNLAGTNVGADLTFRTAGATNVVLNTSDAGAGSLRDAIATSLSGDFIQFDPSLSGQTITLTSGELQLNKNLSIVGLGAANLAVSGNNASRVFNIASGSTVNLTGLTIRNGRSPTGAGNNSTPGQPGGAGGHGGGIFNAGTLNVTNCIIKSNAAGAGGAGYPPVNPPNPTVATAGGAGGSGGGVYNQGTLRMNGCSISGNLSGSGAYGGFGNFTNNVGGTGGAGGHGGGLCNGEGSMTLINCTIASNAAGTGGHGGNAAAGQFGNPGANGGNGNSGGSGGGIFAAGVVTVSSCTISGNSPGASGGGGLTSFGFSGGAGGPAGNGGGIINASGTQPVCGNSIIALNSAAAGPDVFGAFASTGHNFVGKLDGGSGFTAFGDIFGSTLAPANPLLSALANNGGGSLTMALAPNSPAVDAGNDAVTNTMAYDGRGPGFARFRGLHVDIGAYELDASLLPSPTIVSDNAGTVTLNNLTHLGSLPVSVVVNPNGLAASVWFQYGVAAGYGNATAPVALGSGSGNVSTNLVLAGLAPGLTWHYRVAAGSAAGISYGPDRSVSVSVAGDFNGDGVVSQPELDAVYANYVTNSPWLFMTNVAGLGGTNVTFALEGSPLGAYTVEYSTNLTDWLPLGAATPRYGFSDTNSTALPQRQYRLRYP